LGLVLGMSFRLKKHRYLIGQNREKGQGRQTAIKKSKGEALIGSLRAKELRNQLP